MHLWTDHLSLGKMVRGDIIGPQIDTNTMNYVEDPGFPARQWSYGSPMPAEGSGATPGVSRALRRRWLPERHELLTYVLHTDEGTVEQQEVRPAGAGSDDAMPKFWMALLAGRKRWRPAAGPFVRAGAQVALADQAAE